MQSYHCSVAVGHFARLLAAKCSRQHGAYQVVAVLQSFWMRAPDPYATEAVVFVAAEYLQGIVPSPARLSQAVSELRKIGAIDKGRVSGGGYRLRKPAIEDLDALAQSEIKRAAKLREQAEQLCAQAHLIVRESADAPASEDKSKPAVDARTRREALEACGKQLSDVRDVLATLAGLPKDKRGDMRYAGQGSMPVQLAADFVAAQGWPAFIRVCKAVHGDASPDKPKEIKWLFAERNADYLARFTGAA
jgi:hypothetical protein